MPKPHYFFSLLLIFSFAFVSVFSELNEETATDKPKLPAKESRLPPRPSKKRQPSNRKDQQRKTVPIPKPIKLVHNFGVSMSSLTGFEKPGMPIRVYDFNGALPADFNATDHVLDLPTKNHLKILVDPEDVDWTHQFIKISASLPEVVTPFLKDFGLGVQVESIEDPLDWHVVAFNNSVNPSSESHASYSTCPFACYTPRENGSPCRIRSRRPKRCPKTMIIRAGDAENGRTLIH